MRLQDRNHRGGIVRFDLGWITRGGGKRALLVFASTDALCRASQATLDQDRACNGALVHIDSTKHHRALSTQSRRSCATSPHALTQSTRADIPTSMGCRKGILRLNCEQKRKPRSLVFRQQLMSSRGLSATSCHWCQITEARAPKNGQPHCPVASAAGARGASAVQGLALRTVRLRSKAQDASFHVHSVVASPVSCEHCLSHL